MQAADFIKKHFYWKSLVVLQAVLSALFIGCTQLDEVELADMETRMALPSQEFGNAVITHTDNGDTTFVLTAPEIFRYDRTNRAELKGGIHVDFHKNGRINNTLTADEGEVLRDGRELRAIGNVVFVTDSGMTVYTPRLTWTERDHMIRSDTTTVLITEFDTLTGTGLVSTDDLKHRRLFNPEGVSRRSEKPDTAKDNDKTAQSPSLITSQPDSSLENNEAETDTVIDSINAGVP